MGDSVEKNKIVFITELEACRDTMGKIDCEFHAMMYDAGKQLNAHSGNIE